MTKTELNKLLLEGLVSLEASEEIIAFVDKHTKPKAKGATSDVGQYTVFDGEGEDKKAVAIFCTYHKRWEPVTHPETGESLFKTVDKAKNGFARECIEGLKSWNKSTKQFKADKDEVIAELLDGSITNELAKARLAEIDATRDNHEVRADGIGQDDKPAVDTVWEFTPVDEVLED